MVSVDPNEKALYTQISQEYRSGKGCKRIGRLLGISHGKVYSVLRRLGVATRKTKYPGRCVDCGKSCGTKQRCAFHIRIRERDANRIRMREILRIPKSRWRVPD